MRPEILGFKNAVALHEALVARLERELAPIFAQGRDPVLALPTGKTMIPFYRLATSHAQTLQIGRWRTFNLDEYYPINPETRVLSFGHYMETHFLSKLEAPPRSFNILNGQAQEPSLECDQYEDRLKDAGGVDVAILGIGTNGHIAFNEPGSAHTSRTRPVRLHPETLLSNFDGSCPFTHALTLGIGTLLEARSILIVATGSSKASAVRDAIEGPAGSACPASALQTHSSVTWFLDSEAGRFLNSTSGSEGA